MTTDISEKGLETLIMLHMTGTDGLAAVPDWELTEPPESIAAAKAAGSGWLAGQPKDHDRTLILPVAPLEEQSDILVKAREEFAPLTTAITHPERKIALLREYRTRLVADVVTGKLDVRPAARQLTAEDAEPEAGVPADEPAVEVGAGIPGSDEEA
jgi:hypothetical protein